MVQRRCVIFLLLCLLIAGCSNQAQTETFPQGPTPTQVIQAQPTVIPLPEAVADKTDLELILRGETFTYGSVRVQVSELSDSTIIVNRKAMTALLENNPPAEPFIMYVVESFGELGRIRDQDKTLVFQVPVADGFLLSARFIRAILTAHSPDASADTLNVATAATHMAMLCYSYTDYTAKAEIALAPVSGTRTISEQEYLELTNDYCGMVGVAGSQQLQLNPAPNNGTDVVLKP